MEGGGLVSERGESGLHEMLFKDEGWGGGQEPQFQARRRGGGQEREGGQEEEHAVVGFCVAGRFVLRSLSKTPADPRTRETHRTRSPRQPARMPAPVRVRFSSST